MVKEGHVPQASHSPLQNEQYSSSIRFICKGDPTSRNNYSQTIMGPALQGYVAM